MMHEAGHAMKVRMRTDLSVAMKGGRKDDARLIRTLIAAIDNAEAPPLPAGQNASDQLSFLEGAAEVERLSLGAEQVRALLLKEVREREDASAEMSRLGQSGRADTLHAEGEIVRRYIALLEQQRNAKQITPSSAPSASSSAR
jgi:uncharacterized protein YqeY